MTTTNILNILVLGENILMIHRNHYDQKNCVKRFVKLRIVLEVCFILAMTTYLVKEHYLSLLISNVTTFKIICVLYYIAFEMLNSLSAVILGYFYCNHFKEFVSHVEAIDQLYDADSSFESFTKNRYVRFKIHLALFIVFQVCLMFLYLFTGSPPMTKTFFAVMQSVVITICQWRYFYEHFVFFEFIEIIIGQLRFINDALAKALDKLSCECGEENNGVLSEVRGKLQKWGAGCQLLTAANDRLRDFFGFQVELK